MRGLTCERAAERRATGLCPRHDIPAAPGEVLCARCLGHLSAAQRYRVSAATLEAMRVAVASPYGGIGSIPSRVGAGEQDE